MTRGKNRSSKNPRRQRIAEARPAQRAAPGFSQHSHTPWRFPLFPRQLQFSSRWQQSLEIDLDVADYNRRVGLFSFNGQLPYYSASMFNIYRYCRITGVDVRLTVCPDQTGPSAIEMAMARLPATEAVNPTPGFLQTVRGSVYCLTPSAGAPAKTISQSYASFDELGNPVYDRSLWQTEATAASTTLNPDEPVVAVAVRSINGQAAVVAINLQVTYHMEWFDLHGDDATNRIKEFEPMLEESQIEPRAPRGNQLEHLPSERRVSDKLSLRKR